MEAQARATVIYILATDLGFTQEQAGAHFGLSERVAGRCIHRIVDLRDNEPGFDAWLTELSSAIRAD